MSQPSPIRKRRLGEILMDAGIVTELQLNAALSEQRKWGGKLGRTLVEMGFVDENSMTVALSRQLQLPAVDLDKAEIPSETVQFLRVDIAERYGVFPIAGDRKLKTVTIATSDPTNMEQIQELAFYTGFRVQLAVAGATAIDRAIRRYYYGESVVSSDVTTPRELGVSESEFDPADLGRSNAPARAGNADLARQVGELTQRVSDLERVISGQVKALRAVVELLLEKGVVSREEYLAKVRRDG